MTVRGDNEIISLPWRQIRDFGNGCVSDVEVLGIAAAGGTVVQKVARNCGRGAGIPSERDARRRLGLRQESNEEYSKDTERDRAGNKSDEVSSRNREAWNY